MEQYKVLASEIAMIDAFEVMLKAAFIEEAEEEDDA